MRVISVSFLLVFVAFAGLGLGQTVDTVERSITVSGPPELYVRNEDGRTEIASHAGSTVEIRATKEVRRAADEAEAKRLADEVEVRIEQRGARIEVQTVYPERHGSFWRDASVLVHLEIRTPRRSDLDVASEDGSVTIEGLEGELKMDVEDGDLQVSDASGRITIDAEDGDVRLESVRGEIAATLEDGDLTVQGALSHLKAETEDGSVDIRLAPESAMATDWSVRAEDGRIRLALPDGFAAELNVHVDDGSIEIEQPVTIQGKFSNRQLSTTLNGGGHTLRVRTSDGSVRITKS